MQYEAFHSEFRTTKECAYYNMALSVCHIKTIISHKLR